MNFGTLTFLIGTFITLCILTIVALFAITHNEKHNKIWKIASLLLFISTVLVFFGGEVTSESNGARMNKDKTITQFFIFKDETYTEKIRTFGSVKIHKIKSDKDKLNKNVKITRSISKGTNIFVPESKSEFFESETK